MLFTGGMTLDRRSLLAGAAAAGTLSTFPALAAAGPDAQAQRLLDGIADALLADYPENATGLGLDRGARAGLKARLTDRSAAGQQRIAAHARAHLQQLRALPLDRLAPAVRTHVEVALAAHELASEGFGFGFGDVAVLNSNWSYRNAPYVVTQNTGAFVEIPDFLDTNLTKPTAADAEAYLARLPALAAQLQGETERMRADAAHGVVAPDFLLDKAIRQITAALAEPDAQWTLVKALADRTASLPGGYGAQAAKLVAARVRPALAAQLDVLQQLRGRAGHDAGVWRLRQGEAYYGWALRAGTTTRLTPDEVHAMGREELAGFQAEMDTILKRLGYTQGSVGARMTALGKDPRFQFPDNDAGRAQIIAYLGERLEDVRARLPRAFGTLVPAKLVVKRVPPAIEGGAPDGYAGPGAIDGSTPGNFYINLRTTGIWPRYALPTLAYHEGVPGHVWQGEYSYKLPLIRSLLAFNAYSEGWALYAEQLAGELGVYDADPVGRLGYLQSMAFRACRLVVDTGIHAKRWSREQAIQWFAETNGSTVEEVQGEVDRYCAWPGQACGYKVGHSTINRLRRKAQAALGKRYDLKAFDDAVVLGGNVPMTVLEDVVDRYIASARS